MCNDWRMTNQGMLGTSDVAKRLGVNRATVVRWAANGRLPYVSKLPGTLGAYVFTTDAVDAFQPKETNDEC